MNEVLCSTTWIPDELRKVAQTDDGEDEEASEQELQAVLEGKVSSHRKQYIQH